MTKGYEKLLASCQTLSELLYLPLPTLKTAAQKAESIQIGTHSGRTVLSVESDPIAGGKWEDEEERRFFEEIPDLKDYVPRSVLGVEEESDESIADSIQEKEKREQQKVLEEVEKLERELSVLQIENEENAQSLVDDSAGRTAQDSDAEIADIEDE